MSILSVAPPHVDITGHLARLVAHPTHPRPFTIGRDNEPTGWPHTVAIAAESGRCYAVTVAPDVLVIDADDERLLPALDRFADELHRVGWPVLLVESGRPGHRHLWSVIPDSAALDRARARAVTLGVRTRNGPMRPPGAPHRLGLPVRVLGSPESFCAAVRAVRRAVPGGERFDWRTVLRTGQWPRGWNGEGSSSSMVWHICIGANRAGVTLDAVRVMLADPANGGGHAYRERLARRGTSHADHWLTHFVWPSAATAAGHVPPADATEARERLDAIADAIDAALWPGQAGATDRAVLAALVARGHARGSLTPVMSHRELAETAPCSRSTVTRSVARLRAAGWLQSARLGAGHTVPDSDGVRIEEALATRWRLCLPVNARLATTGGTPPARTSLSGVRSRALDDVGRWGGLGLNGPRVLAVLADGSRSVGDLAEVLGLNVGNLRARLLPRLCALGLLVRDGRRWALVDDLDGALRAAGVELVDRAGVALVGKADRVAAQHARERAGYLDWREQTRPRRELVSADRRAAERRRGSAVPRVTQPSLLELIDADVPSVPTVPSVSPVGTPTGPEPPVWAWSAAGGAQ